MIERLNAASEVVQAARGPVDDVASGRRVAAGQAMRWAPRFAVGQLLKLESNLDSAERDCVCDRILADAEQMASLRRLVGGSPLCCLMRAGLENDVARFRAIGHLPFGQVRCPTLVVRYGHVGGTNLEVVVGLV